MRTRDIIAIILLFFSLAACRPTTAGLLTPAVVTSTPLADATLVAAAPPTDAATPPPTATATPPPAPAATSTEALSDEELLGLFAAEPPERDDRRLAIAFRGAELPEATPEVELPPPNVGDVQRFFVGNVDDNTVKEIEATLLDTGKHAYFWFELGDDMARPPADELEFVTSEFDTIYEAVTSHFAETASGGSLAQPVHIVHASPGTLCVNADECRLAGYFSPRDLLPLWANPYSNERPMFVMNSDQFDGASYFPVLAHELRHRVEAEYDNGDEDWAVEGSAMLAEDMLDYPEIPQQRGDLFLTSPDQQLNTWSETERTAHYGQGYLVSRFLYDRLGADLYRELATSPESGLAAVDAIAAANGLDLTGETLWLDWLVAMAIGGEEDAPEAYRWLGPPLGPVAATALDSVPTRVETTVNQFAADYYELPSSGKVTLEFGGAPQVALLGDRESGNEPIWYAVRANYSNPRLTRAVDLTEVDSATLNYRVFADIEQGYDFAYVSASNDGGQTWQPLAAEGMQGQDPSDDPSGSALGERYYTGRTRQWIDESIDLTPFAGQSIQLRFEMITDPILTYDGLALSDITIPEIDFADDGTQEEGGWTADGFVRTPRELPQEWHLQLITFPSGAPEVKTIPVGDDGRAIFEVSAVAGEKRPILVVSATAPRTLQPAEYVLEVK